MVIYLHLVDFYGKCRYSKYSLVGGFFFHPIWKICWSNWIMKPQGSGKNQRNTWSFTTHHTTFLRENIDNSSDLQKDDFFLIQNISIWPNGAIFHQPGFFWNSRGPISLPICYILGWGLLWGRYNLTRNIDFQGFRDTFQWEDSWVPFVRQKKWRHFSPHFQRIQRTFFGGGGYFGGGGNGKRPDILGSGAKAAIAAGQWAPRRKSYSW